MHSTGKRNSQGQLPARSLGTVTGRFKPDHTVTTFRGPWVRIQTRYPMRVDVDGDIKVMTPLEITVKSNAVRAIVH